MIVAYDYHYKQRLLQWKRRNKPRFAEQDVLAALDTILQAMVLAEIVVAEGMAQHELSYAARMETQGLVTDSLTDDTPYILTERLNQEWIYVRHLECFFDVLENQLRDNKAEAIEEKALNNKEPLSQQVSRRIGQETLRSYRRIDQRLSEQRQRASGFTHYIWRSQDDEKVRGLHASYDDQIFAWDNPPEGGHPGHDYGCRCHAEPVITDNTPVIIVSDEERERLRIIDPPIDPVYPEYYLLPATTALRAIRGIMGEVRKRLARRRDERLFRRPEGVPRDWVREPARKGEGVKYVHPNDRGTYVKIQKARPNSSQAGQKVDNVRWQKNGRSLNENGNIVSKQSEEAHIPTKDFKFKPELFR